MTNDEDPIGGDALGELYRRAATETAPRSLDAAVLDLARTDVAKQPSRGLATRAWLQPLAIAAVIVIAVGGLLRLAGPGAPSKATGPSPFEAATGEAAALYDDAAARARDAAQNVAPGEAGVPPDASAAYSGIPACGPAMHSTPLAWVSCIDALDEAGRTDLADVERDALQAAYPDFLPARRSDSQ